MSKIYIIAGEVSGDFIGGKLIKKIQLLNPDIEFHGIGGEHMMQSGIRSLFPMKEISIMGFLEVLPKILHIKKLIKKTVRSIIDTMPDILITIDSPGFNYRVASQVRKATKSKIKIIQIVAPTVWAYKPKRALKYAKIYDSIITILPFECQHFQNVSLKCTYVGHPILEQEFSTDKLHAKRELERILNITIENKIIAVTLGSRVSEILHHAEVFIEALNKVSTKFPDIIVIFVINATHIQEVIRPFLKKLKCRFRFCTDKLNAFAAADLALAKSGTNTLEIIASCTPLVVAYKTNWITGLIIKMMLKIPYVSIVNIIAGEEIVPEFLQQNCNAHLISQKLLQLLCNPELSQLQVQKSSKILKLLKTKEPTFDLMAHTVLT